MIIDRNVSEYTILDDETIRASLTKLTHYEHGMLVCVDNGGILQGILTDGDFRRWIVSETSPDLDSRVGSIINKDITTASFDDKVERIKSLFGQKIVFIPLVNSRNSLVGIARRRQELLKIQNHVIGPSHPCYLVAEIGNNHNGDIDLAYQLVDKAIAANANCVKFQLRDLKALYSNAGNASDESEDLGSQYTLDLLSKFQLSNEDMFRVFDYCERNGITALCTPWDMPSIQALEDYGLPAYKVASADFTNHDLLVELAGTHKPLICSTGMTVDEEIRESVALLKDNGVQYALLHCNSTYPAPFKDLNLRYMNFLRSLGECAVGYSSHDRGINIAVAAVSLGANIIEKHFTLDRTMEGNDHRVSLLPDEFRDMAEGIRQVEEALGKDDSRVLSQGEMMNRESLGKSLWVNTDLQKGEVFEEQMIDVRSPGQGLRPNRKNSLIGRTSKRDLIAGDLLFPSDIDDTDLQPRDYSYRLPFGIPIRYHDMETLGSCSNFDLLEFHLSYKDLEVRIEDYIKDTRDLDLVVHSPELFEGDHVLDLCAKDKEYRNLSIENLEKVVQITRRLKPYFSRAQRPKIVVNVGGFTQDKPLEQQVRERYYEMVNGSLATIDLEGVEVIPQTMPPFPWHFGGQRFHNLFMDPDEIVRFCEDNGYRVCFDISHSKLACNHYGWSFHDFVQKIGPVSAHLHVADASGVDGEGLPIGEGEIDMPALGVDLINWASQASFIPEIWQGHKDNGLGFWMALEKLEGIL